MGLIPRDIHYCDGEVGRFLLMKINHIGVIHFVDMVARQDEHIFWIKAVNKVDILVDGISSAVIPSAALLSHIGRENADAGSNLVKGPGATVTDIVIQNIRAVLGKDTDDVDVRIHTVA